jgi:hypothetical protein
LLKSTLTVEVAPGEVIDKITILEIKAVRIAEKGKLRNVRAELEMLKAASDAAIQESQPLSDLTAQLKAVNGRLWDIEDNIRGCERNKDFGPKFIDLARLIAPGRHASAAPA